MFRTLDIDSLWPPAGRHAEPGVQRGGHVPDSDRRRESADPGATHRANRWSARL